MPKPERWQTLLPPRFEDVSVYFLRSCCPHAQITQRMVCQLPSGQDLPRRPPMTVTFCRLLCRADGEDFGGFFVATNRRLKFVHHFRVFFQELLGVFAALADAGLAVVEEGASLIN
jgi:hypothetical protein